MDTQTIPTTTITTPTSNLQPTTTNNNNENIQFKFFCQSHFYSFTLLNIIIILYDFLMNDDLKREKMGEAGCWVRNGTDVKVVVKMEDGNRAGGFQNILDGPY